jgi:hypothetical protein
LKIQNRLGMNKSYQDSIRVFYSLQYCVSIILEEPITKNRWINRSKLLFKYLVWFNVLLLLTQKTQKQMKSESLIRSFHSTIIFSIQHVISFKLEDSKTHNKWMNYTKVQFTYSVRFDFEYLSLKKRQKHIRIE